MRSVHTLQVNTAELSVRLTVTLLFVFAKSSVYALNTEFVKLLNNADFRAWLAEQGAEAAPTTPDEFAAFIKAEIARYAPLVKKSGMKPD